MKTLTLRELSVLLAAGSLLAAGCVVHEVRYRDQPVPGEVVVTQPPPQPQVETYVAAPDPVMVWIAGAWVWQGAWVWEAGHWDRPPHRGSVWVPHRYVVRGGRHVWVRGGWR